MCELKRGPREWRKATGDMEDALQRYRAQSDDDEDFLLAFTIIPCNQKAPREVRNFPGEEQDQRNT